MIQKIFDNVAISKWKEATKTRGEAPIPKRKTLHKKGNVDALEEQIDMDEEEEELSKGEEKIDMDKEEEEPPKGEEKPISAESLTVEEEEESKGEEKPIFEEQSILEETPPEWTLPFQQYDVEEPEISIFEGTPIAAAQEPPTFWHHDTKHPILFEDTGIVGEMGKTIAVEADNVDEDTTSQKLHTDEEDSPPDEHATTEKPATAEEEQPDAEEDKPIATAEEEKRDVEEDKPTAEEEDRPLDEHTTTEELTAEGDGVIENEEEGRGGQGDEADEGGNH